MVDKMVCVVGGSNRSVALHEVVMRKSKRPGRRSLGGLRHPGFRDNPFGMSSLCYRPAGTMFSGVVKADRTAPVIFHSEMELGL